MGARWEGGGDGWYVGQRQLSHVHTTKGIHQRGGGGRTRTRAFSNEAEGAQTRRAKLRGGRRPGVPGYGEVRGEQGEDRGEEREAVRPDRQLQRAALRDLRARRVISTG